MISQNDLGENESMRKEEYVRKRLTKVRIIYSYQYCSGKINIVLIHDSAISTKDSLSFNENKQKATRETYDALSK